VNKLACLVVGWSLLALASGAESVVEQDIPDDPGHRERCVRKMRKLFEASEGWRRFQGGE